MLFLAACQPVVHDQTVVLDDEELGTVARALSGNGRYVVGGPQFPDANGDLGLNRYDRLDPTLLDLPAASEFLSISDDGERIHYLDLASGADRIWTPGAVIVPPTGIVMGRDLRFGVFVDPSDSSVRRWTLATGEIVVLDNGSTRPAGAEPIGPDGMGVAIDGTIAWFQLRTPSTCTTRFLHLWKSSTFDLERCDGLEVAATGHRAAVTSGRHTPFVAPGEKLVDPVVIGFERVDLVSTTTGAVLSTATAPGEHGFFDTVLLSDDGLVLWAVENEFGGTGDPSCGGSPFRSCDNPAQARAILALSPNRVQRLTADPEATMLFAYEPSRFAISSNGRFFAYAPFGDFRGIKVIDRAYETVESLPAPHPRSVQLSLSDDGRVLVHAGLLFPASSYASGYYERLATG
jgi:hypothetical protein